MKYRGIGLAVAAILVMGNFAPGDCASEKAPPKPSTAVAAAKKSTDQKADKAPPAKPASTISATKSYPKTDEGVRARIADLKELTKSIKIDGKGGDWAGFPMMFDPPDDSNGDPTKDIVRTAVAPTDDALYVMIATKGPPSKDNLAFWLDVDYMGGSEYDYQLGLTTGGKPRFWIFPDKQESITLNLEGIEFKIDEVVEIKIPNSALVKLFGEQPTTRRMTQFLHGPAARSWVRVRPSTWNTAIERFVDFGAAAASFRLAFPMANLDFHTIHPEMQAAPIEVPVRGPWFIFEGTTHTGDRAYQWSCKLNVVDNAHNHATTSHYPTNEQNYCWNKPVYSPVLGAVNRIRNDLADGPHALDIANQPSNEVLISMSHTRYLVWLSSLRNGSVTVRVGNGVQPGMLMGTVGNSAVTSPWPHLHIDVSRYIGDRTSLVPIEFKNVRVGLNLGEDDPWARDLSSWEPREGYFITPLP